MMKRTFAVLLLALATLWLAACSPAAAPVVNDAHQATQTTQPVETNTSEPTAAPSPSATPEPGLVLLVAPPGSPSSGLPEQLARLSQGAGLDFETRPDLQPESLDQRARVVVLLAPPENLAALTSAAPQAQFVVVSPIELAGGSNLSVIRQQPEMQAMAAGFISVLLSTDWRAAALLPGDGPLAEPVRDAFINGGRYFCGICAPGWPLGMRYPQAAELPAGSDGAAYAAAAAELFDTNKAEAYYIPSAAARPEVFAYLLGREQFGQPVLLVGDQAPPEELRPQWAATVTFDLSAALEQLWPGLLAGQSGGVVSAPLRLADVNRANLGEGRLRLVNELLEEMATGLVYPFTLPE